MRRILIAALTVLATAGAASAQCQTELKPTDGFKELSGILKCLADEIATLKAGRGAAAATSPGTAPASGLITPVSPGGVFRGNAGPAAIEVLGCRLIATTVTCQVAVETSKDGDLLIFGDTKVFDDTGEMRQLSSVRGKNISGRWGQANTVGVRLINEFDFADISPTSKALARLELRLGFGSSSYDPITFRNVALTR